jgi:hypothetical protein
MPVECAETFRDNLKHKYINLDYKFCCGRLIYTYCSTIKQPALLTAMYQKEYILHLSSRPRLAYKEIFRPGAEILSSAETWILSSPIGRIWLFKSSN